MRPGARVDDLILREPGAAGLRDPELGVRECVHLVTVRVDTRRMPASAAPCMGVAEVEPVGWELISTNVPVSSAFAKTLSSAMSAPSRAIQLAAVMWPMQSTCGLSIAVMRRSVGLLSNAEWSDAKTHSHSARTSSGRSREPSARIADLDPAEDPERLQPAVQLGDLAPLRLEPPLAQVVRVIGHGDVGVAERLGGFGHLLERFLPSLDQSSACGGRRAGLHLDELR